MERGAWSAERGAEVRGGWEGAKEGGEDRGRDLDFEFAPGEVPGALKGDAGAKPVGQKLELVGGKLGEGIKDGGHGLCVVGS